MLLVDHPALLWKNDKENLICSGLGGEKKDQLNFPSPPAPFFRENDSAKTPEFIEIYKVKSTLRR